MIPPTMGDARARTLGTTTVAFSATARLLAVAIVLLVCGGIPASVLLRLVVFERSAPELPRESAIRDAMVVVTLREAAGTPIRAARIRVLALVAGRAGEEGTRAYAAGEARTGDDGVARLERLPRGEAWVTADAEGHARASTSLVLAGGEREIDLVLPPEHKLEVEVRDERGAPLAGAEVEVAEAGLRSSRTRAGRDGIAHVTRLDAPPWAVTARAAGFDETTTRGVREGERLRVVLHRLGALVVWVVDANGVGVGHARVGIASPTLWPARVADCDAKGGVRIGSLAAGTDALHATAGDRASLIKLGATLARGEEKSVTLQLVPSETVTVRVTGDLAPRGGGGEDAPVAGARVTLAESGVSPFPIEATTDRDGRARLGPIARGAASLAVRAEGYVARALAVPEPLPSEVPIALSHASVVEGRVTDARGFPVDGATIEVVGTGFDVASQSTMTGDAPRFTEAEFASALAGPRPLVPAGELGVMPGPVPAIPPVGVTIAGAPPPLEPSEEPWVTRADGTYRASPASPGRVRVLVHHPQYVDAVSETVSLAPGGTAKLDVIMRAGGTLEGRVLDASTKPVEGARVVLAATRGGLERVTRTASDGTFGFAAVPSDVVLLVSPDDEGASIEMRAQVSVPEGGRRSVTLQLPAARDPLPVKVHDDRGYPVAVAQISATSLDAASALRETVFTNAQGEATLSRAKGLALRVEVTAPGHAPAILHGESAANALEVTLAPAETAQGLVRSTRGDPIADAEVVLYTELGARRTRSRDDGTFTISDLAAGSARLVVRASGFARASRDVTLAPGGGRPITLERTELARGGAVEGVVLDGRGDPIAGARVAEGLVPTYLAVGASPADVAVTDARGRFRLRDLPEGSVSLEAFAPDVGRARTEIRIAPGETTRDVRFSLVAEASERTHEPSAAGSLAITLGETSDPAEVVVVAVAEGSEAERAGLAPGDVIVSVGGDAIAAMAEARTKMSGPLGDDVLLVIRRAHASASETLRVPREPVRR